MWRIYHPCFPDHYHSYFCHHSSGPKRRRRRLLLLNSVESILGSGRVRSADPRRRCVDRYKLVCTADKLLRSQTRRRQSQSLSTYLLRRVAVGDPSAQYWAGTDSSEWVPFRGPAIVHSRPGERLPRQLGSETT